MQSKLGFEAESGLCCRSAQVPQVTNFCVWVTGKTYFFLRPRPSTMEGGYFAMLFSVFSLEIHIANRLLLSTVKLQCA